MIERPVPFFSALLAVSILAYLPMAEIFGPLSWIGAGPFRVQISRFFHYLAYFLAGVGVGAYGLDHGVLGVKSWLAERWWVWLAAGVAAFGLTVSSTRLVSPTPVLSALLFTLCSVTLVAASLAFFLRFAKRRRGILDSLSDNSYGIYVVHYAIVTWLQYGLLGLDFPPVVKAMLAFGSALMVSWAVTATLRRIPVVAKVI